MGFSNIKERRNITLMWSDHVKKRDPRTTPEDMSLQEGIVPLEWKEANIIPLFKKGSRNKSVNYRPVSLTSVICKVLETIIRDHMMDRKSII